MSEANSTDSPVGAARAQPVAVFVAILAGMAGAGAAAFMLRNGVHLTPDGWEYWEGSISLLRGRGYSYYGEAPIQFYPPLFSLYLALVQALAGESGRGLAAAIVLLAGLVNGIWIHLAARLSAPHASTGWRLILAAFLIQFVAYSYVAVLSETIFLCFLGAGLSCVVALVERERAGRAASTALLGITLFATAIALTRNSGLAFVPGFALVVFLRLQRRPIAQRWGWMAAVALVPFVVWLVVRLWLEQSGSHPPRLPALDALHSHLLQLMTGVPELFGPARAMVGTAIALFAFAGLASLVGAGFRADSESPRGASRDVVIVTGSGLVGLVVLMSSVTVGDPLSGRFVWFVPMTAMVLVCAGQSWLEDRRHAIALGLVMVAAVLAQPHRIDSLPYRFPTRVSANQTMSIEAIEAGNPALEHILPPQYPWIVKRRGFALEHRPR